MFVCIAFIHSVENLLKRCSAGRMISQEAPPSGLVTRCLDVLRTLSSSERDLIRVIVEVVHELRDAKDDNEVIVRLTPHPQSNSACLTNYVLGRQSSLTMTTRVRRPAIDGPTTAAPGPVPSGNGCDGCSLRRSSSRVMRRRTRRTREMMIMRTTTTSLRPFLVLSALPLLRAYCFARFLRATEQTYPPVRNGVKPRPQQPEEEDDEASEPAASILDSESEGEEITEVDGLLDDE